MGCATAKPSKALFTKADLLALQKHSDDFNEKRMKILKWLEGDVDFHEKIKLHPAGSTTKMLEETVQPLYWQEAWSREQELVQHPSLLDVCEPKVSCITLIDENLRLPPADDVTRFWRDLESALPSTE